MKDADLLTPGEVILWQGRPDPWPYVTAAQLATIVQGFIALGLFVYLIGRLHMGIPPLWDVRIIVLVIVFKTVPIEIVVSVLSRRASRYILTTLRAITVTNVGLFGERVRALPILPALPVDFIQGKRLSSLYFTQAKGNFWARLRSSPAPGFERISDGAKVFALISQLQKGTQ